MIHDNHKIVDWLHYETAEELILALQELVRSSGRHPSEIYVNAECQDHGTAELVKSTLTDGSETFDIRLRPAEPC